MLELPLHHCYTVAAGKTEDCIRKLCQLVGDLELENEQVFMDTEVVETLTIEMARDLRERGQQKSTGETRCIIRGFDTATNEAQNALLKIIEDPAEGVHFFLVTPQPDQLLETIRSRALHFDGVCASSAEEEVDRVATAFMKAETLSARLAAVKDLKTREELRALVRQLAATDIARKHTGLGEALEQVADWGKDSGASVKLLGQYLATELSRSPKGK